MKSKKKQKRKLLDKKTARLNLMVDPKLKDWAHDYASRKSTSISALITNHFSELKERDKERGDGVKQI